MSFHCCSSLEAGSCGDIGLGKEDVVAETAKGSAHPMSQPAVCFLVHHMPVGEVCHVSEFLHGREYQELCRPQYSVCEFSAKTSSCHHLLCACKHTCCPCQMTSPTGKSEHWFQGLPAPLAGGRFFAGAQQWFLVLVAGLWQHVESVTMIIFGD